MPSLRAQLAWLGPILLLIALVGGAAIFHRPPSAAPLSTPPATATATTAPSPSPTPSPTATSTPLPTPTPTPTPVPLSAPFVGPDGRLFYVEGERLVIVRADGRRIVSDAGEHGGDFTPRFDRIPGFPADLMEMSPRLARLESGCNLAATGAISTPLTTVTSGGEARCRGAAWSPQGTYLAYSVTDPQNDGHARLMVWDRALDQRRLLARAPATHAFTDLQWTPDGCRLYFAQRNGPAVEAIWSVGPDWERLWRVAPSSGAPDEPPPCPTSPLDGRRLVAYYGTPAGAGLGILGRYDVTTTLGLLDAQIAAYRALDEAAGRAIETVPGFHMVVAIADDFPGEDADYNHRVVTPTLRAWIDAVRAAGGWAVLDIQPGRADPEAELALIEPFLWEADVHLAVDPEFTMGAEEIPGSQLGRITGAQINRIQAWLETIARATGRRKLLIIHQFEDRMIEGKDDILHYPFVDLVWDSDGFGGASPKIADYVQYSGETGFEYGGFKVFYDYDTPPLTPEQILALTPPPAVVIYQ